MSKRRSLRARGEHVHPSLRKSAKAVATGELVAATAPVEKVDPLAGYDWYEEFHSLKDRYRDQRVAAYIAWAASPMVKRKPEKLSELAPLLGLKSDRTIRQWREKDETIDATVKELQAAPLAQYRRDIYQALITSALIEGTGGHADRRLALEMLGDYTPRQRQDIAAVVQPFTSDELAQASRELGQWDKETGRQGDKGT